MKLMTFEYTKSDGKTTTRNFIELSKPSNLHFGIDVSELDEEERIELVSAIARVRKEFDIKVAELMSEYDVKQNFRQFKPEAMTNIESELFYE